MEERKKERKKKKRVKQTRCPYILDVSACMERGMEKWGGGGVVAHVADVYCCTKTDTTVHTIK